MLDQAASRPLLALPRRGSARIALPRKLRVWQSQTAPALAPQGSARQSHQVRSPGKRDLVRHRAATHPLAWFVRERHLPGSAQCASQIALPAPCARPHTALPAKAPFPAGHQRNSALPGGVQHATRAAQPAGRRRTPPRLQRPRPATSIFCKRTPPANLKQAERGPTTCLCSKHNGKPIQPNSGRNRRPASPRTDVAGLSGLLHGADGLVAARVRDGVRVRRAPRAALHAHLRSVREGGGVEAWIRGGVIEGGPGWRQVADVAPQSCCTGSTAPAART